MARGVNKVILVGNLGQDPEVRYMPNGNGVATLSLATTDSWKDKNTGQLQERTEWHRVVLFGKLAEVAGEYLRKGSQIYVEGRLQTRKWTDQGGQERYTTEIVVDMGGQMQMLGGRSEGQSGGNYQSAPMQAAPMQAAPMQSAPQQGGYAPSQPAMQQSAPQQQNQYGQNQGGYGNQSQAGYAPSQNQSYGGFAPKPQQSAPQGGASNPMEPPIDFDDDIPF